ncbi:MAG: peptidylprolyl isomerase [Acidimicrobiales bacterium]
MTHLRSISSLVAALVAAALLLGSCGGTSAVAVSVNGIDVDDGAFRDELDLLSEHPQFAQAVFGATVPSDASTVDTTFAAEVLRLRILIELVDQAHSDRGLEVTDDDLEAADETFMEELQVLLDELPDDYQDRFRTWNAQLIGLREALEAEAAERADEVTDAEVEEFYDQYQAIFASEEACARHVLLDTEAEADEVIDDLDDGADFGEVASERSVDPSAEANAGDLGCTGPGQYVAAFEEAVWEGPIGELQGPIETEFGFHVILVDSRGLPSFGELESDIRAFLESPESRDGQQLLNLEIQRLTATADVEVSSRYGTWNPAAQAVEPPDGPTTTAPALDAEDPLGVPEQ